VQLLRVFQHLLPFSVQVGHRVQEIGQRGAEVEQQHEHDIGRFLHRINRPAKAVGQAVGEGQMQGGGLELIHIDVSVAQ